MTYKAEDFVKSLDQSITASKSGDQPYKHWFLENCLPEGAISDISALPFPAPSLEGVSGKRELHNATRTYFDVDTQAAYPVCNAFAQGFQDKRTTDRIESFFGTDLAGTYLRIEYAQDVDGFWLEPHTDLGVKLFTMLLYVSDDDSHTDLGTDIFDTDKKPVARSPFSPNAAMVFIPSDITYHGFEPRPIQGIRQSVIINYVSDEWRAREQLAFPEAPIAG